MSIHTILSQEIEKLMNTMGTDHRIFMLADGKTRNDLENTIRTFATRIVEESKREERDRIIHLAETYKTYYNPINDAQNKGKHMAMDDLIKELQKEDHDKQI